MKKWTSVLLVIMIFSAVLTGCSVDSSINEDAEAFLEDTQGISGDETAPAIENSDLPPDKSQLEKPPRELPIEDIPPIRIGIPAGIPAMSMLGLIEDIEGNGKGNIDYDIVEAADLRAPKNIENKYDIVLLPTNVASIAYNRELEYKLAGVLVWGSHYIVSDEDITDISDLKGKEITAFDEDQASDVVLRYVLRENGIDPNEDVTFTYLSSSADLASQNKKGISNVFVVSEPMLNTLLNRRKNLKVVIDIPDEWSKITGALYGYPQTSVMVSNELIEDDPEAVHTVMRLIDKSTVWINEEPEAAAEFGESLEIDLKKRVIISSIDRANIRFVPVIESRMEIETYLEVLMESSKKLIGGEMPDEEFYFVPPRR